MGLFSGQLANVVEWQENRDDVIFYKWNNDEIKKGSKLIIRPGQDAVFMFNGKTEGIFKDEGSYDIESQIVPFLSTLKGFKFGFNSGMRAEVLFVNTKEFNMKWGTKHAINIPSEQLPGGLPIRANGTFQFKVTDYQMLVEKVAGVKKQFTTDEVRERVISLLDQLLLKWIMHEGKDIFHLQANAIEIARGIQTDLDVELMKMGLGATGFQINTVSYPDEVQDMITKVAGQSMIGNMAHYQQASMIDAMTKPGAGGSAGIATDMAGMQMGMMMGQQMMNQMNQTMNAGQMATGQAAPVPQPQAVSGDGTVPNFCPNCGAKTNGMNFCGNCGQKLV